MKESWRCFGKKDPVTLSKIKQVSATHIVSALYHIPVGEVWPFDEIEELKAHISSYGLIWPIVESLPVH